MGRLHFLGLALCLFHFLVGVLFELVDAVFCAGKFTFAVVAGLFVFVFHLEEFLLGLQDAFFFDDFGFFLGFFEQGVFFFRDGLLQQRGRDKIAHGKTYQQGCDGNDDVDDVE